MKWRRVRETEATEAPAGTKSEPISQTMLSTEMVLLHPEYGPVKAHATFFLYPVEAYERDAKPDSSRGFLTRTQRDDVLHQVITAMGD